MSARLYRSRTDRMVAGVCGGLAHYFDADPALVRLLFVVFTLASGTGALAYVLLWVLVPEEPIEGGVDVSDATPNMTPEPGASAPTPPETVALDQPTYSAPTSDVTPPAAPAPSQPAWSAPAPVPTPVHGARRNGRSGGVMGGVILILVGLIFLMSEFVPGVDIGKLWPLILVAIGVAIIFRRR